MSFGHYLFSFSGRINRAKQWAFILVGIAFQIIITVVISTTIGFQAIFDVVRSQTGLREFLQSNQAYMAGIIICVLWLIVLYMDLAVHAKRLHDRNKSAWWLIVFLILPLVLNIPRFIELRDMIQHFDQFMDAAKHGQSYAMSENPIAIIGGGVASLIGLWAFVEFYCLRGTEGDNRYGPDPLAGRS